MTIDARAVGPLDRSRRRGRPGRWAPAAPWVPAALCALWVAGCGDNLSSPKVGPPIEPSEQLFVNAHYDDDMIFMQPELLHGVEAGSTTTLYVYSGDPIHGQGRQWHSFRAAKVAYSSATGSTDWDCGYLVVRGSPVHHCRLRDRSISLIALDLPDGGIEGTYDVSPLHLAQDDVTSVPILGARGGIATKETIVAELAALITAIDPVQIHALDLAGTHGREHVSHLFSSSFAFWGAARAGYQGAIRWHRAYSVDGEAITLDDADYQAVKPMLGYFWACYAGCAPCGTSCATLDPTHDVRLRRRYSATRSLVDTSGTLSLDDDPALCLSVAAGVVVIADCAGATQVQLDPSGHLRIPGDGGAAERCLASPPGAADPVVLEACDDTPEQYWAADSEHHVWNGRPPDAAPEMYYDHVRCLNAAPQPGAVLAAPICGSRLHPTWHFGSEAL